MAVSTTPYATITIDVNGATIITPYASIVIDTTGKVTVNSTPVAGIVSPP